MTRIVLTVEGGFVQNVYTDGAAVDQIEHGGRADGGLREYRGRCTRRGRPSNFLLGQA